MDTCNRTGSAHQLQRARRRLESCAGFAGLTNPKESSDICREMAKGSVLGESMQPFSGEAKLLPNATKGVHRPLPKEIIFYREHTEGQLRGLIHLYHNTTCTSGLSHLKEEIQKSWKR